MPRWGGEGHDRSGGEGEDLCGPGIAPGGLKQREGGRDRDGVAVSRDVVARGGIDPPLEEPKEPRPSFSWPICFCHSRILPDALSMPHITVYYRMNDASWKTSSHPTELIHWFFRESAFVEHA